MTTYMPTEWATLPIGVIGSVKGEDDNRVIVKLLAWKIEAGMLHYMTVHGTILPISAFLWVSWEKES